MSKAFAVWITGVPASGKSTIAQALAKELAVRRIDVAVLESDALRDILTPLASYTDDERERFYRALVFIGDLLVSHGVPVVFDATANRRAYREGARALIPQFVEVHVDTPLEVCAARDPKGLYRRAASGGVTTLPGAQRAYEPPAHPDLVVSSERDSAEGSARSIVALLERRGFVAAVAPAAESETVCR